MNLLVAAPDNETPDGYVMPDLTGLPVVTAQADLAKVGIKSAPPIVCRCAGGAGRLGQCASTSLPSHPGAVIAEQPPAGARVDQTMEVKLTVAK